MSALKEKGYPVTQDHYDAVMAELHKTNGKSADGAYKSLFHDQIVKVERTAAAKEASAVAEKGNAFPTTSTPSSTSVSSSERSSMTKDERESALGDAFAGVLEDW